MYKLIIVVALALTGCTSMSPPPGCSGEARRINPPSVSVSAVVCEKEAA